MRFVRSPRDSVQCSCGTLVTMSSCVTGALCSRMKVFCSGFLPAGSWAHPGLKHSLLAQNNDLKIARMHVIRTTQDKSSSLAGESRLL